jgi:hypothetical protein
VYDLQRRATNGGTMQTASGCTGRWADVVGAFITMKDVSDEIDWDPTRRKRSPNSSLKDRLFILEESKATSPQPMLIFFVENMASSSFL